MSTLATVRSRIADDLNRSDLNSQITTAINRAILHYARIGNFWFNETSATFSTVTNQFNYSSSDNIPTDLADIHLVQITISSNQKTILNQRTYQYIQDVALNTNAYGVPSDVCYFKSNFYLYPIPNNVYTITVSYRKTYTALSADSDTNDFTVYAEDLIESYAEWWIYYRVIKDFDKATAAKTAEKIAYEALQQETTRITKSGFVVPTGF